EVHAVPFRLQSAEWIMNRSPITSRLVAGAKTLKDGRDHGLAAIPAIGQRGHLNPAALGATGVDVGETPTPRAQSTYRSCVESDDIAEESSYARRSRVNARTPITQTATR